MGKGFFIIGTDTGVGKTVITAALLTKLNEPDSRRCSGINKIASKRNSPGFAITKRAGVFKPVQSGGTDAQFLLHVSGNTDPLELVCPYLFKTPVAPALASKLENKPVCINKIINSYNELSQKHELVLVEGAGGFHVPIKDGYLVSDLAEELNLPVIIVARLGLGTINHTLLTIEACRQKGLSVAGIIFNQTTAGKPGIPEQTNPKTIEKLSGVPVLGVIGFYPSLKAGLKKEKFSTAIPVLKLIAEKINEDKIASLLTDTGIRNDNKKLKAWDRKYIWHPFTQMKDYEKEKPVIIDEGKGSYLKDIDGNKYIDGISSLWVNVHGHRKKELDEALKKQISKISHSTLLGLSNTPAIQLAQKLVSISPKGLCKVFYSDNGSTAVEIALKIAFQYQQQIGNKKKTKFISFINAYHGDTIGSVSVGGMDLFHKVYKPLLFDTIQANAPYCYRCFLNKSYPACKLTCLKNLEDVLKKNSAQTAALIIEPLIQGAAGMLNQPAGYVKKVRELCTKYNVLMIADEVATGFGRTGAMFACEKEKVTPDILCLAKSITGGYLPLAATLTTQRVYSAFLAPYQQQKTFFHGHTYTGNPLACALALENLALYEKEKLMQRLQPKIAFLKNELKRFNHLKHVGDIRQQGMMAGIELVKDKFTKEEYQWQEKIGVRVIMEARKYKVLLRPLGPVIVLMPPLGISIKELKTLLDVTYKSIRTVTQTQI